MLGRSPNLAEEMLQRWLGESKERLRDYEGQEGQKDKWAKVLR
jgi:hypothetical protein